MECFVALLLAMTIVPHLVALAAARGGFFPSSTAIAEISGFMK
jgi:hypothetical protein